MGPLVEISFAVRTRGYDMGRRQDQDLSRATINQIENVTIEDLSVVWSAPLLSVLGLLIHVTAARPTDENGALHPLGAGRPGRFAMPNYTQVDYTVTSHHGVVGACLRKKRQIATPGSADKISGIASASCCSAVFVLINGNPQMIIGNSRNKVPYKHTKVACVHGECNALWDAFEESDGGTLTVVEMYIEMHPCPKCAAFLLNALPPNLEVMYSFPYSPAGVADWTAAARALCT